MDGVSNRFSVEMDEVIASAELVRLAASLAKVDPASIPVTPGAAATIADLHKRARSLSARTVVANDGAFLAACALYELAVKDVVEAFLAAAKTRIPTYVHLPAEIRDWNPIGCANVLVCIKEARFGHLTMDAVVRNLASCVNQKERHAYDLLPEAFSFHDNNITAGELEKMMGRLGVEKLWQKLSRQVDFATFLGSAHEGTAENRGRLLLKNIIDRRNNIIHRGRSYFTPSHSEICDAAEFLRQLMAALVRVLDAHLLAL